MYPPRFRAPLILRGIPALLAALLVLLSAVSPSLAAGVYPAGTTGYDLSYPNQTGPYPASPFGFGIVGVTGGRPFTQNAYLASQYRWAQQGKAPASLYMNLSYAVGSTASQGLVGPLSCTNGDKSCRAYNYGYQAALQADQWAQQATGQSKPAATWWLDIETANSWSPDATLNRRVIQGALTYWQSKGITVGIYSTPAMWQKIAGNYAPGASVPSWVAGAGTSCSTPLFGGSPVWLVQRVSGGYDVDTAC